ncbi:NAD(P)-dependent alcohol dehydrogenase [Cryptosporangium arvum]|uniref:alcohol dehydrogenase n=1 Tax=Cryptosporangium arvum DSM 44712 TaxID=927661 RepID=A0A010Z562_9ACTN|nr:NAD(P)-dependent alcohol dehydrogenase [Cryptosporangium arvum]EXG82488.1 Zn-dependent alcohol dehydrogenase [Cryptosporangium arvum DSM 44712]
MRALRLVAWHHDPEFAELPVPDPGPGQVLVRVGGAGVCHSDLHLLHDFPPGLLDWPVPFTLGHENAGWVHAVGAGVDLEPGLPVAVYGPWGCGTCRTCATGAENYCASVPGNWTVAGLGADGGMAEYLLVPSARFLVPLPDGLSPAEAAPLTDAALTPYHAIAKARSVLTPGATAVVIGIGGLGHLAVQILRATTDSEIIAVDTKPEALELAKTCGADHLVHASACAEDAVRNLTRGAGAAAVLDLVGSDATLSIAARSVAKGGQILIVGLGGGVLPVSLLGTPYGVSVTPTYWGTRPELHEVLRLAARGDLRAEVRTWPLSRATDAYAAVAAGTVPGRAVVVPG